MYYFRKKINYDYLKEKKQIQKNKIVQFKKKLKFEKKKRIQGEGKDPIGYKTKNQTNMELTQLKTEPLVLSFIRYHQVFYFKKLIALIWFLVGSKIEKTELTINLSYISLKFDLKSEKKKNEISKHRIKRKTFKLKQNNKDLL